jgi:thymidylate synthase
MMGRTNSMDYMVATSATQAFEHWYNRLSTQAKGGFKQESRGGAIVGEIINACTVIIDPRQGIVESKLRNMSVKYALGELLWYMSGSNQLKSIVPYSKAWDGLSDDGETVNSAYGYRIRERFGFNQWDYVREMLTKDPLSRQAVIHIKDASRKQTKDTPCTMSLQFLIREGRLYMTTIMRSNDIWLGFPYDVFSFTALQVIMAMELGVEVGEYTHIAGSLHLYERNWVKEEADSGGSTKDSGQGCPVKKE